MRRTLTNVKVQDVSSSSSVKDVGIFLHGIRDKLWHMAIERWHDPVKHPRRAPSIQHTVTTIGGDAIAYD